MVERCISNPLLLLEAHTQSFIVALNWARFFTSQAGWGRGAGGGTCGTGYWGTVRPAGHAMCLSPYQKLSSELETTDGLANKVTVFNSEKIPNWPRFKVRQNPCSISIKTDLVEKSIELESHTSPHWSTETHAVWTSSSPMYDVSVLGETGLKFENGGAEKSICKSLHDQY